MALGPTHPHGPRAVTPQDDPAEREPFELTGTLTVDRQELPPTFPRWGCSPSGGYSTEDWASDRDGAAADLSREWPDARELAKA